MDRVETLFESFLSGHADKCEVVSSLADIMDIRVVSFFLQRVLDTSEDDVVRIEILDTLAARGDEPKNQIAKGVAIMKILRQDSDTLIRQHAAKAMRHFASIDGAVDLLEEVAFDEREDDDVRHNAVAAIEANASRPDCQRAIYRIMQIPMFHNSARRTIERLSLPQQ